MSTPSALRTACANSLAHRSSHTRRAADEPGSREFGGCEQVLVVEEPVDLDTRRFEDCLHVGCQLAQLDGLGLAVDVLAHEGEVDDPDGAGFHEIGQGGRDVTGEAAARKGDHDVFHGTKLQVSLLCIPTAIVRVTPGIRRRRRSSAPLGMPRIRRHGWRTADCGLSRGTW